MTEHGGEYCAEETDQEESADENAEWSGGDTEASAMENEAETTRGGRGITVRHGRKWRRYHKEAERDRYLGAQQPEGATPGRIPARPQTRRE